MWSRRKDYFAVLGVRRDSSVEEIRQAYYQQAKTWHPDLSSHQAAATKFKDINEAYEILKNDRSRAQHLLDLGIGDEDHRQSRYSQAEGDYEYSAEDILKREKAKANYKRLHMFERIVHPRNLFVLLPIGLVAYFGLRSLSNRMQTKQISSSSNAHEADKVDAWYNER